MRFTGASKPWLVNFDAAGNALIGNTEKHSHTHLKLWWQIFNNSVRPQLNKSAGTQVSSVSTTAD